MTPFEQERFDLLEKRLELLEKERDSSYGAELRRDALFAALRSLLFETVQRYGISETILETALMERAQYFHHQALAKTEDQDKGVAASLDDREDDEVSAEDSFPLLPWKDQT